MKLPSKKVILIEDNPADAELTRLAFQAISAQPKLIHCSDGDSFFSTLPDLPLSEIHYVMLDLNMPGMSGFEVLKKLQENQDWCRLPVIVLTSSGNSSDVLASYDLGANAYVVKPLDLADFGKAIQVIDDFWSGVNVRPF